MKRFLFWSVKACCAFALVLASFDANESVYAQTGETDVAQSMGVGMQSRFATGAKPIEIERTEISPGTPMSVTSTMNKMISTDGGSFGGILGRYDTSTFGKFFGSGSLTPRTPSTRIDSLDALAQGDNEVENVETERMYPPRLVLDFTKFPIRTFKSNESRLQVASQIKNALERFDFDAKTESVRVAFDGRTVYLRGQVRTVRFSRLLESVVGLQAGVDRVVNELNVLEPNSNNVDLFGNSNM